MKNSNPTKQPSPTPDERPDWDDYFLNLADLAATRSTCLRRQVGAILVSNHQVLATGYNGAPRGLKHCLELGCLRERLKVPSGQRQEICRAIHAEQNAILQSARYGTPVRETTLYCTTQPCATCAKLLLNLEVCRMVVRGPYPDELALNLLDEAGFTRSLMKNYIVWIKS